ncbi:MAG TPA: metal ABC transporter permease, partial [Aggregatilineales bacterium]|nr:metal ABC transporter permease [Aggregatilineales bacterium]
RLSRMMLVAAVVAVGSGVVGLYLSFRYPVPSGASIVLTCTACFGLVWAGRAVVRLVRKPS